MSGPGSGAGPRAAVATAAGILCLAVYLVALHTLVVRAGTGDPSRAAWTLGLMLAPWLISSVTAFARGRFATGWVTGLVVAVVCGGWFVLDDPALHVAMLLCVENLVFTGALSVLFGSSLVGGREPLVTRLARIVRGDDMPAAVLRYTRRVTLAWALFFALLGILSTVLFFAGTLEAWSTFVNLLQWPLVIVAFAVEYGVRLHVLRGIRHSSPMTGFRTFARRNEP